MILYKCIRFSEAIDQMFRTTRGAAQGSFRATFDVASVFVRLTTGWGAWRCFPHSPQRLFLPC